MDYYNYKVVREISGSILPRASRLFIEDPTYGLYLVDKNDLEHWKTTKDEGASVSIVDESYGETIGDISVAWHDRGNHLLYFCGFVDHEPLDGDLTFHELNLSGDAISYCGEYESVVTLNGNDIIQASGNTYCVYGGYDIQGIGEYDWEIGVLKWDGVTGWSLEDSDSAESDNCYPALSLSVVVGNKVYFPAEFLDLEFYMYEFDASGSSLTQLADAGAYGRPTAGNQRNLAWDGNDTIYCVANDGSNDKLLAYSIAGDSWEDRGVYNIVFQQSRNNSGEIPNLYPKAFHMTDAKVYQIHPSYDKLLNIANLNITDEIIAISDNYLVTTGAELWKYQNCTGNIKSCEIKHRVRDYPKVEIVSSGLTVEFNQVFQIWDLYTSSGTTQSGIIFEGLVEDKDLRDEKTLDLESPANEIDVIRPIVSYTGATPGEVVTGLIETYCKYVVTGTIDTDGLTGTYGFKGEKTLRNVFNWAADQRLMNWYLNGTGALQMNGGDVHSQVTGIAGDKIWDVDGREISKRVNKVLLNGGISGGVQITGLAENTTDQAVYGEILYKDTYSHVQEPVVLSGCAVEILNRERLLPLEIEFSYRETKTGFIQPGENFRMETGIKIKGSKSTLATGDYIVNENYYYARRGVSCFRASDGLLFKQKETDRLEKKVQENSDLIQQILDLV